MLQKKFRILTTSFSCWFSTSAGLRSSPQRYGLLSLWHGQCPKYQSHPLQDTITRILCGWISNCTWILEVHMQSTGFSRRFQGIFVLYYACMIAVFFTTLVLLQVCSFTNSTIFLWF